MSERTQFHAKKETQSFSPPPRPNLLQRKCACGGTPEVDGECAECRKRRLQRRAYGHAKPETAPPTVHETLSSPGQLVDAGTGAFMEPRLGHAFSKVRVLSDETAAAQKYPKTLANVQPKLTVNTPRDPYEQEADRVAEQVVHMPAPQRIQAGDAGQIEVPPIVGAVLAEPGQPLDPATRAFFEPRFGHDFSQVRVHTDAKATESARAVNAQAYTVAQHIVLDNSRFSPGSGSTRLLMAHELTHVVQQGGASSMSGEHRSGSAEHVSSNEIQRQPALKPTSEDVWGLRVTRSMCGCRQRVRDGINWADTAAATYAACDIPANPTGTDVEACFDAAHPSTGVAGSTSPSGTMTLPPPSVDPCERIENKGTFVHETMHSRHTNVIALRQGAAFFREWRRLAGDPNRLDTLRASFPAEVAAFEAQWDDGHDWAQDEVSSYRWERRFLTDALTALNRICD